MPKWFQNDPKLTTFCEKVWILMICVTAEFYKTIKICKEYECFLKTDLHVPKVTTQLSQSGPKVIQSHSHTPKMTPKWPQSDPKVIPKWGQTHKWKSKVRHRNVYFRFMDPLGSTSYTTVAAKLTTRWSKGTIICQSDSKITPKVTTFCEKVKMLMICVTP